jgi:hypothetical protein
MNRAHYFRGAAHGTLSTILSDPDMDAERMRELVDSAAADLLNAIEAENREDEKEQRNVALVMDAVDRFCRLMGADRDASSPTGPEPAP